MVVYLVLHTTEGRKGKKVNRKINRKLTEKTVTLLE